MRKVVENERLIYKCCKLYYEERMTQQKISQQLGVSRVTVSRLLSLGRERGIVTIQVVSPNALSYTRLAQNLERLYGLKEVVVVESDPLGTSYDDQSAMSTATIQLMEQYMRDGSVVGVSMGFTLHNICQGQQTHSATEPVDCTFVPLVGGIQNVRTKESFIHANRIASDFARIFQCRSVEFFAPAIFSSPVILEAFRGEAPMREIESYYSRMDFAVVSVGIPHRFSSTVTNAGYMSVEEFNEMVELGAVGDLALQFFDCNGMSDQFRSFNTRVSGMGLERIRKIENRLCIAGGKNKAEAILAAIRGGYINMLVTETECARQLLALGGES